MEAAMALKKFIFLKFQKCKLVTVKCNFSEYKQK